MRSCRAEAGCATSVCALFTACCSAPAATLSLSILSARCSAPVLLPDELTVQNPQGRRRRSLSLTFSRSVSPSPEPQPPDGSRGHRSLRRRKLQRDRDPTFSPENRGRLVRRRHYCGTCPTCLHMQPGHPSNHLVMTSLTSLTDIHMSGLVSHAGHCSCTLALLVPLKGAEPANVRCAS